METIGTMQYVSGPRIYYFKGKIDDLETNSKKEHIVLYRRLRAQ
jgi:hypothetical protein